MLLQILVYVILLITFSNCSSVGSCYGKFVSKELGGENLFTSSNINKSLFTIKCGPGVDCNLKCTAVNNGSNTLFVFNLVNMTCMQPGIVDMKVKFTTGASEKLSFNNTKLTISYKYNATQVYSYALHLKNTCSKFLNTIVTTKVPTAKSSSSKTPATTKSSTIKTPATTKSTTTTAITSTKTPATTKSTTATTTTKTPATTKSITTTTVERPTTSTTVKTTATSKTNKPITKPLTKKTRITTQVTNNKPKDESTRKGKIVLLVFAVIILLVVITVLLYFKCKKKLSNQPAYYNDIAINDPLRYELDSENDDGDEIPLFN